MARELYFAVGSGDALHSGVWKAWTQADEFYAAGVGPMPTLMKLSVHSSGICRLANVEPAVEGMEWDRDQDPRVLHRWKIARLGMEDSTLCFSLLVPSVFIPVRLGLPDATPPRHRARIVWVEPAPLMFCTVVDFVRTKDASEACLPPWAASASKVGVLDLLSGGRIWCVRRVQALPMKDFSRWQNEVTDAIFTVDQAARDGGVFCSIQSAADFSSPVIREVALGLSNFRVGEK